MSPYYSHPSMFFPFWFGLGIIGILLAAVSIVLKGYALWHASKRNELWWFIALLVINTAGILELIYLLFIVKKWTIPGVNGPKAPTNTSAQSPSSTNTSNTN